jgi:hypothetical protein
MQIEQDEFFIGEGCSYQKPFTDSLANNCEKIKLAKEQTHHNNHQGPENGYGRHIYYYVNPGALYLENIHQQLRHITCSAARYGKTDQDQ